MVKQGSGVRGQGSEVKRLKSLVRQYRTLVFLLMIEAENYTDGLECPFCSGNEGYQSGSARDDGMVKHTSHCATHVAERLEGETI